MLTPTPAPRSASGSSATFAGRGPTAPTGTASSRPAVSSTARVAPGSTRPACPLWRRDTRKTPTPMTAAGRSCAATGRTPGRRSGPPIDHRADAPRKSNTSAETTSTGALVTTVKNIFRSNAVARSVSARAPSADEGQIAINERITQRVIASSPDGETDRTRQGKVLIRRCSQRHEPCPRDPQHHPCIRRSVSVGRGLRGR